jgi:hypothetical protein
MNSFSYAKVDDIRSGNWSQRIQRFDETGKLVSDVEDFANVPAAQVLYGGSSALDLTEGDYSGTDSKAVNKLRLAVKDQKINLAVTLAESTRTSKLFFDTAKKITETVIRLRKGDWNGAVDTLGGQTSARKHRKYIKKWSEDKDGAVASSFLELQYGWRPLMSDAVGAAEFLAERNIERPRLTRTSSSSTVVKEVKLVAGENPFRTFTQARRKYKVKYTVYYATSPGANRTKNQLGFTNPLSVAWELVPWSFVVDWFLPIGNYISSLDATQGLQFHKGCKTTVDELRASVTSVGGTVTSSDGRTVTNVFTTLANSYVNVHVDRGGLLDFPHPQVPHLKNPLSVEHVANGVALLTSVFGGRPGGGRNRPNTSDSTRPIGQWYNWGSGPRS